MTDLLHVLETRRSVAPVALSGTGPSPAALERLLRLASRVPDHGKLVPWRFIVFQGEAREQAGDILAAAFAAREPGVEPARIAAERKRMTMAPLIVGVVSRAAPHGKIPEWEQELTAGAVCMNLLIGARAMGYAGSWLTNWFSYDRDVLARFGVAETERMAGFIHIGHAETVPEDRPRPPLEDIVTYFSGEPS
jgi:nitroreductase